MRVLIFTYDEWDDDKGAGWHSFRGAFAVTFLEEARRRVEEVNNGGLDCGDLMDPGMNDYQIVDADTLELLEVGEIEFGWAEYGNTVVNSRVTSHT